MTEQSGGKQSLGERKISCQVEFTNYAKHLTNEVEKINKYEKQCYEFTKSEIKKLQITFNLFFLVPIVGRYVGRPSALRSSQFGSWFESCCRSEVSETQ